ncbi:hypothetical protein LA080_000951 [Diaporthe eres]|nr:hypothetical protein LA080_000951 [Diaporthe eres]
MAQVGIMEDPCPVHRAAPAGDTHLETDQCASGELTSVAISAGVVLSGYLIQRNGLPTLGLSLQPQDHDAVDLREHWADITRGLPDECRNALWEAMLHSCDPDPYPTNAAYHLVQGMSHLGDVYDESWDTLLYEVFTFVVGAFSMHRGDWPAACAIVHRVCAHLERRAEANGSELADRGGATVASARDAALRESRKTFLEKVVGFKHGTCRLYEQPSGTAIQQGDDVEPSDGTRQQGKASASRGNDVLAYAATTDLLAQAADLVIEQLPPSREYASNPEAIDFLDWHRRASVFIDAAFVKQKEEDHVRAAHYFMQCVYQVPENTIATPFNAAYFFNALADCFACAFLQRVSDKNGHGQERRELIGQEARDEYLRMAFHLGLEQLQSSRPLELLGYALHWSRLAVREAKEFARGPSGLETADPEKLEDQISPEQQQEEGKFLFGPPDGSAPDPPLFLALCSWMRCAVLSLAGRNVDALETAHLALDSATRSEDHELVARLRRLVSDVEEDVVEEEGEDEDEEGEGEAED